MNMFARLAELERKGKSVALATIFSARGSVPRREGSKMLVFPDGSIEGTVGGGEVENRVIKEAIEALAEGKMRKLHYNFNSPEKGDPGVCGGEVDILIEPFRPQATVVVVGGGHVGAKVASLAKWLGYRVVVNDDRPDFACAEAIPEADEHIECQLADLPERLDINADTYLVLTTRSMEVDVAGLPSLFGTPAAYLGIIGSRRRWELCVNKLREQGVAQEDIERVTSPIGLEIGAETPEEIALSVMAQIITIQRGGTGESMAHAPAAKAKGA